jgi:hypothetical protein
VKIDLKNFPIKIPILTVTEKEINIFGLLKIKRKKIKKDLDNTV